jgi:predicted ArsR family transcriptional regulator
VIGGRSELAGYWDRRFFESTRGRIATMLRRASRTVEELARELDLTDNGVRAHLVTLERDGIVQQRGLVRSGSSGKPAYVYELTPKAEDLFAKAYEPVLRQLLDVLDERVGPEKSESLLREVGSRIADECDVPVDGVRTRVEAAVGVLNELGGLAELEEHDGFFIIRGYSCPLTSVVSEHPEICRMAETLLTEVAGIPVHERCDRSTRPRCCFEVSLSDEAKLEMA